MTFPQDSVTLIVGLLLLGSTGAFFFLVKKAFGDLSDGLQKVDAKLDGLALSIHANDTEVKLLGQRLDRFEKDLEIMRDDLRKMREG